MIKFIFLVRIQVFISHRSASNKLKFALAFLTQISRHIWPASSRFNLKTRMASTLTAIEIPDGFKLYTENTSLLISSDEAFLNPVQEFNRDLSVACIRVWSEEMNSSKEARWRKGQEKKAKHATASSKITEVNIFHHLYSNLFVSRIIV